MADRKTIAEMTPDERADLQRSIQIIEDKADPELLAKIDRLLGEYDLPTVLAVLATILGKAFAMTERDAVGTAKDVGRIYFDYALIVASTISFKPEPLDRKDH